ncbi:hypothetical protein OpiT1DRAFT_03058 [Opitutaceae bacterium TAV1]|nr:hypothetical protein OpiT1DRAFT_03058 [Opitutaceae bacterium TAV1]
MNRFYLIVPLVLVALFGGVYWNHTKHAAELALQKEAEALRLEQAETAKKAEAEAKAREDAARRAAERQAEEKKKEEEKQARQEAESAKIAADTKSARETAAARAAEIATLEKQLTELRAGLETLHKDTFELNRRVELARIERRNAELEVQRLTEMIARKAGTSLVNSSQ